MKPLFSVILSLLFVLACKPVFAQDDIFVKEYLERLENSQKYLLVVAEMMPEEYFGFKPTPESLSFAEQLMHIGWAMDWHSQSLMGGRKARDWETDTELKVDQKNKAEMMATLDKTFDTTIAFIKSFDLAQLDETLDYFGQTRTKRQILLLLTDHITHHRSQMLVYMRLKGIKPPRYVLYQ